MPSSRLREMFDDPLFARHPKGIEPTKHCLALGPRIADVLNRTRAVLVSNPLFDPGRPHRFTIGQTDGSIPILVALMDRLRSTAPNIELHVRRVDADGLIGAIDRQELDLGFAVMPSAAGDCAHRARSGSQGSLYLHRAARPPGAAEAAAIAR